MRARNNPVRRLADLLRGDNDLSPARNDLLRGRNDSSPARNDLLRPHNRRLRTRNDSLPAGNDLKPGAACGVFFKNIFIPFTTTSKFSNLKLLY